MFWKKQDTETARLDAERNAQAKAHAENYVPPVKRIGEFVGIGDHACRASEIEEISFGEYPFEDGRSGFDNVVIDYKSGTTRDFTVPLYTGSKWAAEILKAVNGGGK